MYKIEFLVCVLEGGETLDSFDKETNRRIGLDVLPQGLQIRHKGSEALLPGLERSIQLRQHKQNKDRIHRLTAATRDVYKY